MSTLNASLSDTFASIVEQQGTSVVRVEGGHRVPSTGIVWSDDGLIVTAHHTLDREENIEVGLPDGRTVQATLLGSDPSTDIAVLKADATGLKSATFAELNDAKVGHLVVALGRPGRSTRAAVGIISALGDADGFRTRGGGRIDRYLEADVSYRPGFAGGPLLDLAGRVIGMNTPALVRHANIAVPTATIRRVVEKLVAHGKVQRAYLGLGTYPVRLPRKLADTTGQESALLVVSVQPDGPADKAGFFLGDVLFSLDGKPLQDMGELLEVLNDDRIAKATTARVWRAGQTSELTITPVARGQ